MKPYTYLKLVRPRLLAIPGGAGACGALMCHPDETGAIVAGTLIPAMGWAAAQVFNDYFDRDVDRIVHPEWPIPSGEVSRRAVLLYGGVLTAVGLVYAACMHPACVVSCVAGMILAVLYSAVLKRIGIAGNLAYGLAVACCALVGATAGGAITLPLVGVMAVLTLVHGSDNIIGTLADLEFDEQVGMRTLPVTVGLARTARIAYRWMVAGILLSLFLWILGMGVQYLPLCALASFSLWETVDLVRRDPKRYSALWVTYSCFMGEILLYMAFVLGSI